MFISIYVYIWYMVKPVSLSNRAYEVLSAMKKGGESFSDVILRISLKHKKGDLMKFFGKWPGDKNELDGIKKMISEDRKKLKLREVSF